MTDHELDEFAGCFDLIEGASTATLLVYAMVALLAGIAVVIVLGAVRLWDFLRGRA